MNKNLIKILGEEKVFPIIRNSKAVSVVNTAKALADGGIKVVEINVESREVYGAIREII